MPRDPKSGASVLPPPPLPSTDKILPCIPFFLRDSEGHVSLYNHGEDASIPSGMMDVVACLKEAPIL